MSDEGEIKTRDIVKQVIVLSLHENKFLERLAECALNMIDYNVWKKFLDGPGLETDDDIIEMDFRITLKGLPPQEGSKDIRVDVIRMVKGTPATQLFQVALFKAIGKQVLFVKPEEIEAMKRASRDKYLKSKEPRAVAVEDSKDGKVKVEANEAFLRKAAEEGKVKGVKPQVIIKDDMPRDEDD